MKKLPTVTLFVAAFTHYLAADFIAASHGQATPVKAPPKAAISIAISSSTSSSIDRFDAVLGRELRPMPPADPRRFNQG
jgi:hypothetical protein